MVIALIVIVIVIQGRGTCDPPPSQANAAIERDGVSSVTLGGHSFQCGRGEVAGIEFEGVKNGKPVRGVLCGLSSDGPFIVRYR